MTSTVQLVSAGTATGTAVKNSTGDDLGKIEDVMLDANQPRIAYAVLTFGGFLGVGNKLFAVPWEALRYDDEAECYRLSVDKDRLEQAPGFDKDKWPRSSDPYWSSIHDHYGVEPYWR